MNAEHFQFITSWVVARPLMLTSLGFRTCGAILALHLSFLCIGLSSFGRFVCWDVRQDRGFAIARVLSFVVSFLNLRVLGVA
jgi:hypothetical protein